MEFYAYDFWRYVHILLFVYWLGADLGVYYAAKYVARADLTYAERMRFLDLTLLLDMGPRTGLVLLFPVGFQMWSMSAIVGVSSAFFWFVWVAFVGWLALVWITHWQHKSALGLILTKIDLAIRYVVVLSMIGVGVFSLFQGEPFANQWLAWKVLLYGCVIATGVYLRSIIAAWGVGFKLLQDDATIDKANHMISVAARKGEWGAYLLWFLVAVIAYLGVAKPL